MSLAASICIPCHSARRLAYLREAVDSARAQTRQDIEIVLSNDAREPTIEAFAHEQMQIDPRIRYRFNAQRLGLGGNWDAVARDARGEYLIIIGDDDRLLPQFVERLLAAGSPNAAVIFSNQYIIDSDGKRRDEMTREFLVTYAREKLPGGVLADAAATVWRNSVPMSAALIRTVDVQRLGFKTDLNTPEIELFARLAAEGKSFVFVPDYLAEYRVHPASETSGGLAGERLIKYLDPIPVPPHVEPLKRTFIGSLVVHGVSKALRQGDLGQARSLMQHPQYPSWTEQPVKVTAHRVLSRLEPQLARRAISAVSRTRHALRRSLRRA